MDRAFRDRRGEMMQSPPRSANTRTEVIIPAMRASLLGTLTLPADPAGLVVFAHGSGSSRRSPRNGFVADRLLDHALGTLLVDLLTGDEEALDVRTAQLRFDIELLAQRLLAALKWVAREPGCDGLPLGLFGASTGAAAALIVAADQRDLVQAVVSRGGRPDLAGDALRRVLAPTLLVVGELDPDVLELNERAMRELRGPHALHIVPGATHLFEEPGALEQVAKLASDFFVTHLPWDDH
jgi:putative phosphoribosyl transferase